jgi:hypothetical protein
MHIRTMSVSAHRHRRSLCPRHTHLHRLRVVTKALSALKPACPLVHHALAAADRLSEGLCLAPTCLGRAPDRRKATTSFVGELGSLGTGSDVIHPCR